MNKSTTAILWMCLFLAPSLAKAENPVQRPEISSSQVSSLNEERSGHNLVISGAMISDDELFKMVGHGIQTPLPKGTVIYGGTGILPARIKLWDEADKAPVNTVHSQAGLFNHTRNNR